jgi:signal transduction histidine kinase
MHYDAVRRYGCDTKQVAAARTWVQNELQERLPTSVIDDATLIVSELLTNAIRAGCTEVSVGLTVDVHSVQLSVADNAPGTPQLRDTAPSEASGRGLPIVAALAADWGVTPSNDHHKVVWATLVSR